MNAGINFRSELQKIELYFHSLIKDFVSRNELRQTQKPTELKNDCNKLSYKQKLADTYEVGKTTNIIVESWSHKNTKRIKINIRFDAKPR